MSIVGVNYGVSHKLSEMVKNLVNLLKVVGVGKAHKYFKFMKLTIAKQLAVWRLGHNGESP